MEAHAASKPNLTLLFYLVLASENTSTHMTLKSLPGRNNDNLIGAEEVSRVDKIKFLAL